MKLSLHAKLAAIGFVSSFSTSMFAQSTDDRPELQIQQLSVEQELEIMRDAHLMRVPDSIDEIGLRGREAPAAN